MAGQSYDLFLHNCNNFSNDFAMFLVGKGIPKHITSLPQTVLNTPFGQMLKPQLDHALRGITQAPVPQANVPAPDRSNPQATSNGLHTNGSMTNGHSAAGHKTIPGGTVYNVTTLSNLDKLLGSAKTSCAVIFFTSATCPPCKLVYPAYDELAAEFGSKAVLIKVDLSNAYEVGARYQVRVTPTFMTFLKGEKENEWAGANEGQLRGNVRMLIQMAHPPHPHTSLRLPTLQRRHKPVIYSKIPPLDKLIAKIGPIGNDHSVTALKAFISHRQSSGAADSPLPDLKAISAFISTSLATTPPNLLFPLIDLLRLSLVDPRVSGYLAEEGDHNTILAILSTVINLGEKCPYTLRIVTLQMACNLFTSPLYPPQLLGSPKLATPLVQLVSSSLLDTTNAAIRVSAASLAFNIAATNHQRRLDDADEGTDLLSENNQVELLASLIEAIERESESKDALRGLLSAVGLLAYKASSGGEVIDLCEALGAKAMVGEKKGGVGKEMAALIAEVMEVLG